MFTKRYLIPSLPARIQTEPNLLGKIAITILIGVGILSWIILAGLI